MRRRSIDECVVGEQSDNDDVDDNVIGDGARIAFDDFCIDDDDDDDDIGVEAERLGRVLAFTMLGVLLLLLLL